MADTVREGMCICGVIVAWLSTIIDVCRKPVTCGSVISLQHLQTRMFLHSHNFRSPLSNNQEVSCFGNNEIGDEGT